MALTQRLYPWRLLKLVTLKQRKKTNRTYFRKVSTSAYLGRIEYSTNEATIAYIRKADSLYVHSYEDEIRRHMQISKSIEAEYCKTGDKVTRTRRLLNEEVRQKNWRAEYGLSEVLDRAATLKKPEVPNKDQCSSPRANQWN
ncbi:hypothetical protein OCU04_001444 [Sclerotinia nivalis]|uniref:Uncharacterized protein n=1 Tax=Sclerotinia nivalis TaxID=352851 RepID=A0A9X0DRX7_9HELO|nr:hypothetical protein OCU04_001444 [Sclerotinia nivalis]